ncbi:MAG: hypothetical protein GC162_05910 [Planctomycetes bacterium]|nr:hypothetical protein [Planctomycetota bacterium]
MKRHRLIPGIFLVLLAGLTVESRAAVISVTQATLTSATQISADGIYVSGANVINANNAQTVNGVLFKAMASGSFFEGPANTPGTFRYVAGSGATSGIFPSGPFSAALNTLLDSTLFGNGAADMAVVGLDASKIYRLQLLMADNRNTNSSQSWVIRAGTFTGAGAGTYTPGATLSTFSIASLGAAGTHNAEIVTIIFTGQTAIDVKATGGGQAFLNAMALHIIPAPAALPAGLGLFAMLVTRRRK